ncbi:TPA: PIG-L family deacetylase [Salmonella enterica subsp. enterica serovar Napoli]|nr:PIG-L family deacetylase [Salmonella enterica subsp. enterica serovar Napoli]HBC0354262.1 PIG-L family deacetylase [Salmonella enterica subsp. enterica serovar Napoli]
MSIDVIEENIIYHKGILAIGAHPDDIELGCGASLARYSDEGYHVVAVVMTKGEKGGDENTDRHYEALHALESLGCKQVFLFHFEDTRISLCIDKMINSLEDVIYNHISSTVKIVRAYTMHKSDRHQDHRSVHYASIVACRSISQILCYETPSIHNDFNPQIFESITEELFSRKLYALSFHKSQSYRRYMQEEELRTVAKFRGIQAGCELSEGFVVHKIVV